MMQQHTSNSYLFGGNAPYVEELYEAYLNNPGSVPDNWRSYFDAMQHVPAVDGSNKPDVAHASVIASFAERAKAGPIRTVVASADAEMGRKRVAATPLIAAYRYLGSRWANLDPLQRQERPNIPELETSFYGFSDADMDTVFNISNTYFGPETATLRDLLNFLRDTYTRSIGAEYMYISDPAEKRWLQERLESIRSTPNFTADKKKHILERLTAAEGLERYLHLAGRRRNLHRFDR
jgi:2-oxoglutarate dehydrogenase E1 component